MQIHSRDPFRRSLTHPVQAGSSLLSSDDWQRVGRSLRLSPRELELVQHIFAGKKLQVIAQDMHLSLGTIKTYSQRIHHKLRVTDQRELTLAVFSAYLGS